MALVRNMTATYTASNDGTALKLYQPGKFPGTEIDDRRYFGLIVQWQAFIALPTIRTEPSGSGIALRLYSIQGAEETTLLEFELQASVDSYYYNFLSALAPIAAMPLSADTQIWVEVFGIDSYQMGVNDSIAIFGTAIEQMEDESAQPLLPSSVYSSLSAYLGSSIATLNESGKHNVNEINVTELEVLHAQYTGEDIHECRVTIDNNNIGDINPDFVGQLLVSNNQIYVANTTTTGDFTNLSSGGISIPANSSISHPIFVGTYGIGDDPVTAITVEQGFIRYYRFDITEVAYISAISSNNNIILNLSLTSNLYYGSDSGLATAGADTLIIGAYVLLDGSSTDRAYYVNSNLTLTITTI